MFPPSDSIIKPAKDVQLGDLIWVKSAGCFKEVLEVNPNKAHDWITFKLDKYQNQWLSYCPHWEVAVQK